MRERKISIESETLIQMATDYTVEINKLKEVNARLRGALIEMLTAHGTRLSYARKLFSWKCDCHACTTARKLLAGE